jgi:hypothetical protein
MITTTIDGHLPQIDKAIQLNDKMLELAQELLLEELAGDSLFACGDDFTSKLAGQYGLYETINGEVISFQPKASLNFTLISEEFVITGDLASIKTISPRLSNYELSITGS